LETRSASKTGDVSLVLIGKISNFLPLFSGIAANGSIVRAHIRRRSCDTRFVPNFYKPSYKLTVLRSSYRAKNAIKSMVAGPRLELGTYGL
jgi:hypothetical protein